MPRMASLEFDSRLTMVCLKLGTILMASAKEEGTVARTSFAMSLCGAKLASQETFRCRRLLTRHESEEQGSFFRHALPPVDRIHSLYTGHRAEKVG